VVVQAPPDLTFEQLNAILFAPDSPMPDGPMPGGPQAGGPQAGSSSDPSDPETDDGREDDDGAMQFDSSALRTMHAELDGLRELLDYRDARQGRATRI
jgi:hypothetical protein